MHYAEAAKSRRCTPEGGGRKRDKRPWQRHSLIGQRSTLVCPEYQSYTDCESTDSRTSARAPLKVGWFGETSGRLGESDTVLGYCGIKRASEAITHGPTVPHSRYCRMEK